MRMACSCWVAAIARQADAGGAVIATSGRGRCARHIHHRRGGVRRPAGRAADGGDCRPAGRPVVFCRRRRARHGGAGPRQPGPDRRPRHQRLCRDPGPAARRSFAISAGPPVRSSPRVPMRWSSSTAPISPTGSRGGCARRRRRFRSSTTCRRPYGRGGRVGPPRCGAMSITCSRCCRSSRMRTAASAARHAPMSAIPWPSRSRCCAPVRTKPRGAMPTRPWSSSCRGAAAARSGVTSRYSARRWPRCRSASAPSRSCCRRSRTSSTRSSRRAASGRRRRGSSSMRRRNGPPSARRGRRSQPPGRSRSNSRSRECRPSSPTGSRCSRS